MIILTLVILTAMLLSSVAAYYSILGLVKIFPAFPFPIVVMGGALELAKIVSASWLFRFWDTLHWTMRSYLLTAILLLMIITSLGIFGFLSAAHLQSTGEITTYSLQLDALESRKAVIMQRLEIIKQLPDTQDDIRYRRIISLSRQLEKIVKDAAPLREKEAALTNEMGPIRYVAELFYNAHDTTFLDKAVRLIILCIIVVFDPLAIVLFIAVNHQLYLMRHSPPGDVDKNVIRIPRKELAVLGG